MFNKLPKWFWWKLDFGSYCKAVRGGTLLTAALWYAHEPPWVLLLAPSDSAGLGWWLRIYVSNKLLDNMVAICSKGLKVCLFISPRHKGCHATSPEILHAILLWTVKSQVSPKADCATAAEAIPHRELPRGWPDTLLSVEGRLNWAFLSLAFSEPPKSFLFSIVQIESSVSTLEGIFWFPSVKTPHSNLTSGYAQKKLSSVTMFRVNESERKWESIKVTTSRVHKT